jgi:hypothetical protein
VENAVKYAVAPARRPVIVRVEASQAGEDLVLRVQDDGEGPDRLQVCAGTGVGLDNVRRRLEVLYAGRGVLAGRAPPPRLPGARPAAPDPRPRLARERRRMSPLRVLLADDEPLALERLQFALRGIAGVELVGAPPTARRPCGSSSACGPTW